MLDFASTIIQGLHHLCHYADLIFYSGTYNNPETKAHAFTMTHVEIFTGGSTGHATIGQQAARNACAFVEGRKNRIGYDCDALCIHLERCSSCLRLPCACSALEIIRHEKVYPLRPAPRSSCPDCYDAGVVWQKLPKPSYKDFLVFDQCRRFT